LQPKNDGGYIAMILTLLILVFAFRIRHSVSDFFEMTRKQYRILTYVFLILGFTNLFFSFLIGMKTSLCLSLCIFVLDFSMMFVFRKINDKRISEECFQLVKFIVYEMKLGNSLYTSFQSFFSKTDAIPQQKTKYFLESVFFPQQKTQEKPKNPMINETKKTLEFASNQLSNASQILEFYLQKLKKREEIKRKIHIASQSAKAQAWVCSLMFIGLFFFQWNNFGWQQLQFIFYFSVTIFGIGCLLILYISRKIL
tara:strand:+ start:274 stop:1035 length:762 start_codon:yes stop_codon:yes gene_type:complete